MQIAIFATQMRDLATFCYFLCLDDLPYQEKTKKERERNIPEYGGNG